jgi:DNA primase
MMEGRISIEIEEPDFMNLVSPEEKEELKSKVTEAIKSRVLDLFVIEMRKLLKERYNLSPKDAKSMLRKKGFWA